MLDTLKQDGTFQRIKDETLNLSIKQLIHTYFIIMSSIEKSGKHNKITKKLVLKDIFWFSIFFFNVDNIRIIF